MSTFTAPLRRRPRRRLGLPALTIVVLGLVVLASRIDVEVRTAAETLATYGAGVYLLTAALVFVETGTPAGLVLPTELVVPLAGAAAAAGAVNLVPLVPVVWAAAVAGDCTGYLVGRRLGRTRWYLTMTEGRHRNRYDRLRGRLIRHGTATVVLGRFLPSARTLTPLAAGSCGMALRRFAAASVTGAGPWAALVCGLGFVLYRSLEHLPRALTAVSAGIGVTIIAVVLWDMRRRAANA